MINILWVILGAVALVLVWVVVVFNGFIRLRNRSDEAASDIDVQMKRRFDLIPNLVETVKGYMAHEKGVLESVTAARTQAMGAEGIQGKSKADNVLSGTLKTLFAVAESYPDLKANVNFLDLQRELADTENKIQAARRFYNTNVMELNTKIDSFPSNVIATSFNFKKKEFFELTDSAAKEPVKVSF